MKNIKLIAYLFIAICTLNSCTDEAEPKGTNFVTFESDSYSFGVDIDGENTNGIKVYAGSIMTTARTFNLSIITEATTLDAAAYAVPTSVTIPANSNVGEISMSISDVNISAAGETLTMALVSKAGVFVGGNITLNVKLVCPTNPGTLQIAFDNYPEEVYWDIKDADGTIVATSNPAGLAYGGHANEAPGTSLTYEFCWDPGTYTFRVFDQYADGGGAITIIFNGAVVYSTDGVYGGGESASFTI
tara:strand:- start:335 stop:1069 length:735 start_codon:yes stop_codon:yes gene_type:complete